MDPRVSILSQRFNKLSNTSPLFEYDSSQVVSNLGKLKPSTANDLSRRLLKAKSFIDNHQPQKLFNATIATAINMSEYHFVRTFKKAFGISPRQYIILNKLNIAKEMLKDDNYSISGIAFACGFPDTFSFSKSFKKQFGKSPSQYKNLVFKA